MDITLKNFETDLINGSLTQPVLLDIWAPWCGPCKALGPVLEKLETAYAGRFKLAKLNADEQPEIAGQLSQMFGVRSIPFCVLFKAGQPVDGFVGALPEAEVRKFLDTHVAGADALADDDELGGIDAASELADDAQAVEPVGQPTSEQLLDRLADAVAADPANTAARCELLRGLLSAGFVDEARQVYDEVATKVMTDALLVACGHWISACEAAASARPADALAAAIAADKRDFNARYELAQGHFAAQRFTAAMDELLEIVMRDKAWNDGAARKTYVAILELMAKPKPKQRADAPTAAGAADGAKGKVEIAGAAYVGQSDPLIDSYRRKLSMAMY